jgi:hypothetical protein
VGKVAGAPVRAGSVAVSVGVLVTIGVAVSVAAGGGGGGAVAVAGACGGVAVGTVWRSVSWFVLAWDVPP